MSAEMPGSRCLTLVAVAVWLTATPVQAQRFEIGLGVGLAETQTNAVGLGATIGWNLTPLITVRSFADGEFGMLRLKEGLGYEPDTNKEYIVDKKRNERQNPIRNTLWQGDGVHIHTAAYVTLTWWRLSAGPGLAYNGHDGKRTSGLAGVLIADLTSRSELDIELLRGGSWRLRLSLAFWDL